MATEEHFEYDFDLIPGTVVKRFYYFEPSTIFQVEEGGDEQFYNYIKVYEKAKEIFSGDNDKLDRIEKNFKYFEEKNRRRNRRARVLKEALERHNLILRKDSWLSKQYIFYRSFSVRDVVFTMHKMDVLHKKCGIKDKWYLEKGSFINDTRRQIMGKKGKSKTEEKVFQPNRGWKSQMAQAKNAEIKNRNEMSLWAIKDLFYDREYMMHVKDCPEDRFQWVVPSYTEIEKNQMDYNQDEEENGMAELTFDEYEDKRI